MIIKMLKTAAGPQGSFSEGQRYEVGDDMGAMFVAAGSAVRLDRPAPKPEVAAVAAPETAEAEIAEKPKPRRGRRAVNRPKV